MHTMSRQKTIEAGKSFPWQLTCFELYSENILLQLDTLLTFSVVGPYPQRDRDYRIQSNFWKFYFIKTDELVFLVKAFKLVFLVKVSNFWKFYFIKTDELVFLVKVFRLFQLEWIFFWVLGTVDTVAKKVQHLM